MDERIRQEYHRIYSELYLIILAICCVSVLVKVMLMQKNLMDCWMEYVILVGSPLYRFIRCRMLHVVIPVETGSKMWKFRLIVCMAVVSVIYCLAAYIRTGNVSVAEMFIFLIPFVLVFFLVSFGAVFLQKRWQKKMESEYDDD